MTHWRCKAWDVVDIYTTFLWSLIIVNSLFRCFYRGVSTLLSEVPKQKEAGLGDKQVHCEHLLKKKEKSGKVWNAALKRNVPGSVKAIIWLYWDLSRLSQSQNQEEGLVWVKTESKCSMTRVRLWKYGFGLRLETDSIPSLVLSTTIV